MVSSFFEVLANDVSFRRYILDKHSSANIQGIILTAETEHGVIPRWRGQGVDVYEFILFDAKLML